MKRNKTALLAFLGAGLCMTLTGCGAETVDLNRYVTLNVSGYDGYGTVDVSFNYDAYSMDTAGLKFSKSSNGAYLFATASDYLYDVCIGYTLSENSDLSNGDEVTLHWTVHDEVAEANTDAKLKYQDITIKVENLEEPGTFDAFEGVNVIFSGDSPFGKAEVEENNENLSYKLDKDRELSNGDVVMVSLQTNLSDREFLNQFSALPETTEKQFMVEGLPFYAQTISDVPDNILQEMDEYGHPMMEEYGYDPARATLLKYYLLKADGSYLSHYNAVGLIYRMENTDTAGEDFSCYWYVEFPDVKIVSEDTAMVDLNNVKHPDTTVYEWGNFIRDGHTYAGYESLEEMENIIKTSGHYGYAYRGTKYLYDSVDVQ